MSRKCDSMDNATQVERPARRNRCLPASRPCCRTSQTPRARHHKNRHPRICRCMLVWGICATSSLRQHGLSQHGYGQQQHRKGRPTWWIPGWAPGRRAAAAPATSTRLSGPACEDKLGPKTFLERWGSSCNAGCREDQPPSKPFLRPFRDAVKSRPDCLQVPSIIKYIYRARATS